jgi:hypothetical protein
MPQEILEKFEFFPIKCRIQRALEVFELRQQRLKMGTPCSQLNIFKTKVSAFTHQSCTFCLDEYWLSFQLRAAASGLALCNSVVDYVSASTFDSFIFVLVYHYILHIVVCMSVYVHMFVINV